MNILRKAKVAAHETGNVKPSWNPVNFSVAVEDMNKRPEPSGFGLSKQYRMTLACAVEFWANSAQYAEAVKQAEKVLLNQVHQDVLRHLALLRSAIHNQDEEAALKVIEMIQEDLGL